MFRTLPPTAAPVYFKDLMRGMMSSFNGGNGSASFSRQLQDYFQARHVFPVSSGKAALYLSLKAMEQTSSRREVIIPAYASFCLASAVAKTGLPVKLCDIDPASLDFDFGHLGRLVDKRTLAVIPVHNYGLVSDLERINKITHDQGALVLEDAAQGAGALWKNQKAGTLGDAGIISLGRGKNICTLGGGIILTNQEALASKIREAIMWLPKRNLSNPIKSFLTGLGLSFFLNPSRYGLPARLPFLNLGANIFDPDFEVGPMPALNSRIGQETFPRLNQLNQKRVQKAERLKANLILNRHATQGRDTTNHENSPGQRDVSKPIFALNERFFCPESPAEAKGVYLRFPVIFTSPEDRRKVLNRLVEKGLGANPSYPTPLDQIAGFKPYLINKDEDFPGARYVAERIMTLPTHEYLTDTDIDKIINIINKLT